MSDARHLLALETVAIDTDLQWRQAKAQRLIEMIDADELHPMIRGFVSHAAFDQRPYRSSNCDS